MEAAVMAKPARAERMKKLVLEDSSLESCMASIVRKISKYGEITHKSKIIAMILKCIFPADAKDSLDAGKYNPAPDREAPGSIF